FDIALTARELNDQLRIVLRLFDETLAAKVVGAFAMPVVSTSQVAAPAFVAAATGRKVYQAFQLAEQSVHLTDLTLSNESRLVGKTVGDIQADKRINIVMHQGPGGVNVNPDPAIELKAADTILVIAPMDALLELERLNQPADQKTGGNGPPVASAPATAR
ncbi:MAG: TrkA C-terminal domain-containing protein, partial [Isosphaeraceae bacterium]